MRVGLINPYGTARNYSGPALYVDRLMREVARTAEIHALMGERYPSSSSTKSPTWLTTVQTVRLRGALGRAAWILHASLWIVRNAGKVDIIHFHGGAFYNILPALVARLRNRPYSIFPVGEGSDLSQTARVQTFPVTRFLRRYAVSRAALGFALSDGIALEFRALGLPPARVVHITSPLDSDIFDLATEANTRKFTVGFVGMLIDRKGPRQLISALGLLHARGFTSAGLVLIGPPHSADYLASLQDHAASLGVSQSVDFLGFQECAPCILAKRNISLLGLPSTHEGLPAAVAEAMALGIPVVATDVGAIGSILRESGAGRIVTREPQTIADAICYYWSDQRRYLEACQSARDYARNHFMATAVADLYTAATQDATREAQDVGAARRKNTMGESDTRRQES